MGSLLLANRKGIGPAADCMECLYEEFFLTSWANGDPALLEWYADDPSNVHHSYLNDPVVFRNFHAGPKETHVFHLHAHQWFAGNDPNRGSYLDSQTVAPQQGFTYNIYHGGLRGDERRRQDGWWDTPGLGQPQPHGGRFDLPLPPLPAFRARHVGALARARRARGRHAALPDGQADAGLSLDFATARPGAVPTRRAASTRQPAPGSTSGGHAGSRPGAAAGRAAAAPADLCRGADAADGADRDARSPTADAGRAGADARAIRSTSRASPATGRRRRRSTSRATSARTRADAGIARRLNAADAGWLDGGAGRRSPTDASDTGRGSRRHAGRPTATGETRARMLSRRSSPRPSRWAT